MFALRILDIIFRKYRDHITYAEERNMKITTFLEQLIGGNMPGKLPRSA